MPKGQLLFSVVFGSRKAVRAIFSEFDETKTQHLIFLGTFQKAKVGPEGSPGGPTPPGGGAKGGHPPMVWLHQDSTEAALPPI